MRLETGTRFNRACATGRGSKVLSPWWNPETPEKENAVTSSCPLAALGENKYNGIRAQDRSITRTGGSSFHQREEKGMGSNKEQQLQHILDSGIVAVVRSPDSDQLVEVAKALLAGGVDVIEITMTVPDALEVVKRVRAELGGDILLGAGTILDTETARAALLAGAEFLVAPILDVDVIRLCQRYSKIVMPGAFTPTEIRTAWEAGADIVKVFPADVVGPAFFKAMRGPLPQMRLMPTGGVDLNTARSFLEAGVCCLGVGSSLVEPKTVAAGDFDRIRDLAKQYVQIVNQYRDESS